MTLPLVEFLGGPTDAAGSLRLPYGMEVLGARLQPSAGHLGPLTALPSRRSDHSVLRTPGSRGSRVT